MAPSWVSFPKQKMKSLKFRFWVVVDLIKQVPLFFRQRNCRSVASGVIGYDTLCGLCLGNEWEMNEETVIILSFVFF